MDSGIFCFMCDTVCPRSMPNLCSNFVYKIGQDFMDTKRGEFLCELQI